jgi:hypothetical protein
VLVLVAGLVLTGNWASYHAPGRNDQYQLIQLGQCVYHGGRMYVDCWENKPPGIAWLSALGLAGARGNPIGPWILPGIIEAAVLLVVWAALRRLLCERTARKAVLLTAVVYALRIYDTPSINPDFYSSMFELAAIALFLRGVILPLHSLPPYQGGTEVGHGDSVAGRTYSYPHCAAAGLLWAAATSIKQVGCVGFFVLTLSGVVATLLRPNLRSHVFKAILFAWTGFLSGVVLVVVVLWHQGTLREAWSAIFAFNSGLAGAADFLAVISNRGRWKTELAPLALPLWLALTGVIMSFWYRRFRGFPLSLAVGLLLWWIVAGILACMGPSRSMRYWQATFPPMLVLAAVGLYYIQQVQDRLGHPERLTAFVVAVTAAVLLARPAVYELRAGLAASIAASCDHPTEREQLIEIGDRVRGLVGGNEPVYVLDYRPGIYVYADRPVAARFNYPRSVAQLDEMIARLEAGRAKLIVEPEKPASEFLYWCDADRESRLEDALSDCNVVDRIQGYRILACSRSHP